MARGVEIVIDHFMAAGLKRLDDCLGNRVTETPRTLVAENHEDVHGNGLRGKG